MNEHERIILTAAAAILDALHTQHLDSSDYYAAVSASHAAFELRHAIRQIEDAAKKRASTTAA